MLVGAGKIITGSLGVLSEALYSALDLCAAVITFFAVRFSDKPADAKHHYGHGKIESFSALIETISVKIPRCDIVVSTFPVEVVGSAADSSMVMGSMTKNVKALYND